MLLYLQEIPIYSTVSAASSLPAQQKDTPPPDACIKPQATILLILLLLFLIAIIGVLNQKLMSNTYKIKGKSMNTGQFRVFQKTR